MKSHAALSHVSMTPELRFHVAKCLFQVVISENCLFISVLTGLFVLKKIKVQVPLQKYISWSVILIRNFELAHDYFSHRKHFPQNLLSLYLSLQFLHFVTCVKRPGAPLGELKILEKKQ